MTVAVDYDETLRDLDRGVERLAPLRRANDEGLAGVGKSVVVMRGDALKTHIVLSAGLICPIVLEEADRDEEDSVRPLPSSPMNARMSKKTPFARTNSWHPLPSADRTFHPRSQAAFRRSLLG